MKKRPTMKVLQISGHPYEELKAKGHLLLMQPFWRNPSAGMILTPRSLKSCGLHRGPQKQNRESSHQVCAVPVGWAGPLAPPSQYVVLSFGSILRAVLDRRKRTNTLSMKPIRCQALPFAARGSTERTHFTGRSTERCRPGRWCGLDIEIPDLWIAACRCHAGPRGDKLSAKRNSLRCQVQSRRALTLCPMISSVASSRSRARSSRGSRGRRHALFIGKARCLFHNCYNQCTSYPPRGSDLTIPCESPFFEFRMTNLTWTVDMSSTLETILVVDDNESVSA